MKNSFMDIKSLLLIAYASTLLCTPLASTAEANNNKPSSFRGPASVETDPHPLPPLTTSSQQLSEALSFTVQYFYRSPGQQALKSLTNGSILRSGDHYKIQFTPDENCYVYIFQVDSTNTIYPLFPVNDFNGIAATNRNPVRVDTTYHLPAEDKSFFLDQQKGIEMIYFLAFRNANPTWDRIAQQLSTGLQQGDTGLIAAASAQITNTLVAMRGVGGVVEDPSVTTPVVLGNTRDELPLQRLQACDNCVSKLMFFHD